MQTTRGLSRRRQPLMQTAGRQGSFTKALNSCIVTAMSVKLKLEGVRDKLKFVAPQLNPLVLRLARTLGPLYVKRVLGLRIHRPEQMNTLLQEYQQFAQGSSKLIIVFRHVHVHDAQVLFYTLNNLLPSYARAQKVRLANRPHAHFLYGRGVPVWGGKRLEWLFSRLGGIPVHHRKLDRNGLDVVRSYMLQGKYPIALAPEGQVTYHNQIVHELEPGFAHLCLWAQKDLQQKGLDQDVRILPISQYYQYGKTEQEKRKVLLSLIKELQTETGMNIVFGDTLPHNVQPVLASLGADLISRIEQFYTQYYGMSVCKEEAAKGGAVPWECSRRRIEGLVDALLRMQEQHYCIQHPPKGFTPRIYIVRLAGWNRIFVQGEAADSPESPLDVSLSEYLAAEAELYARHLEVVDLLAYFHPEYALESQDTNRHIEYLLNLLDAANRVQGGTIGQRRHPRSCQVSLQVGEPLSLSDLRTRKQPNSERTMRSLIVKAVEQQFNVMTGSR